MFSAVDCINAGIENFRSLCRNVSVHCGICNSVNEPLERSERDIFPGFGESLSFETDRGSVPIWRRCKIFDARPERVGFRTRVQLDDGLLEPILQNVFVCRYLLIVQ